MKQEARAQKATRKLDEFLGKMLEREDEERQRKIRHQEGGPSGSGLTE